MRLKVLSYNIREGGARRLPVIADVVERQHPDVVALLEANSRSRAKKLARDFGMHIAFGRANSKFHIAWLSRLPIVRVENHRLGVLTKTLLEIEVNWDGAPLRLFATHLAGGADARHPAEEVPAILDVLRPLRDQPYLLVGDFNSLRPGDSVGTPPRGEERMADAVDGDPRRAIELILEAGHVDCYRSLHPQTPGYTYPSDAPWLRLDYIFAPSRLACCLDACDIVVGDVAEQASDHFPIWADFRSKSRP